VTSGVFAARTTSSTPSRRHRDHPIAPEPRIDSALAARAALAGEPLALPRSGGRREALRLLLIARRSAVDVRREALVQLRSVIVTAPDRLRDELRGLPVARLLGRCSRLRRSTAAAPDELACRLVLRTLARRIVAASVEAAEIEREILAHVRTLAPRLLDEPGVGPIVAAQLIVAWSHHGRLRSRPPSPASPASPQSPPPAARPPATASAAAATGNSTAPSTRSSSTAANTTRPPSTTSLNGSPRARPAATPPACSNATSPATSTGYYNRNR
jgi:hypothetical protein